MEVRVLSSALFVNLTLPRYLQTNPVIPGVHPHATYLPLSRDFMPFFMPFSPEVSPIFSEPILVPLFAASR
jgi:hypothetical protein